MWHCGPVAAFIEEEVIRWLCDLVGYGPGSFGLCTSGGVMANFIAMALVRDIHLRASRARTGLRGAALEGARVYTGDQTHFLDRPRPRRLGPPETLVVLPTDDAYRLHAEPVADAIAADQARGLGPVAICAICGLDEHGIGRLGARTWRAGAQGPLVPVDAAYGGAAGLPSAMRRACPASSSPTR
ncbi:MAG: hypothetical protein U0838_13760 [Chloroflexota bacterium]